MIMKVLLINMFLKYLLRKLERGGSGACPEPSVESSSCSLVCVCQRAEQLERQLTEERGKVAQLTGRIAKLEVG